MKYLSLIAVLIALNVSFTAASHCHFTLSNDTYGTVAEYDLSPMLTSGSYRFTDSRSGMDVEYYVNFCANITKSPSDTCLGEDGNFVPGPALQRYNAACMRLGYDWNKAEFAFEDVTDPTQGVQVIHYGDPIWCPGPRKLVIHIQCTDNYVVPHDVPVVENNCKYDMYINTIFSCPLSCGIHDRHLCGNQGSCHFDKDSKRAHCYCNAGYYGKDCSYQGNETTNMGATEYVLLVLFIFEILIFILIIVVWIKVKNLRLDKSIYTTGESGVPTKTDYEKL